VVKRVDLNQRKILSLDTWKELAAKNEAPTEAMVLASADIVETKQLDDDGNVYRFVISTQNPDRDKDVIRVDGWRFENYNKNPVVLFGHNYRALPVAAGSAPAVEGDRVLSDADFSASRIDAFADTVRQFVKAKILRASSVGFDPLKWMYNEERRGYDFVEQELLEWSIVPVPANAEALQLAKSLNLDLDPIKQWAIRALDEWSEEKSVLVPRSLLENATKVGEGNRVFVLFDREKLDQVLAGKAKPEPQLLQTPPDLSPVLSEINASLKTLLERTEKRPIAEDPSPADPVVDKKETDAIVLELVEQEAETTGDEPLYEVDPEELRRDIREAIAPLVMQRTGRVL
jgi:HK97 family phage prohead protease